MDFQNTPPSKPGVFNKPRQSLTDFLRPHFDEAALAELDQPISRQELEKQLEFRREDNLKRAARPLKPLADRLISASELHKCSRELAYLLLSDEYAPVEMTPPAKLALWEEMAALGDIHHERWQTLLKASGLVYLHPERGEAIEQYTSDHATPERREEIRELHVTARFDLIFDIEGAITQGEIKTVQGKDFDPQLPWFFDKLKTSQTQISLWGLDLLQTTYVVINRDAPSSFAQYMLFTLDRDDYHITALIEKADRIRMTVLAGGLPDPEPGAKRRNCGLCKFKSYCPAWDMRYQHRYIFN